jgi:hypothetical protein
MRTVRMTQPVRRNIRFNPGPLRRCFDNPKDLGFIDRPTPLADKHWRICLRLPRSSSSDRHAFCGISTTRVLPRLPKYRRLSLAITAIDKSRQRNWHASLTLTPV